MSLAEKARKIREIRVRESALDLDEFAKKILEKSTPVKGIHYKDGEDGKDGRNGLDGKNGIDGKNGRDGKDADEEKIVEKVLFKLPKPKEKKYKISDIEKLEDELIALRSKVSRNYGGHGGTLKVIATTTLDNTTFTLVSPCQFSEMWVIRGSGLVHYENGDFTYTLEHDRVKTITLITPLMVAQGETLLIRGK